MIRLDSVRHRYGRTTVLDVPHYEAAQGEHHLLLGVSGSGKTTLLHVLAGLLRPTEGSVVIANAEPWSMKGNARDAFRGRNVGIVFQRMHLFSTLTVEQNLLMAPYMAGLDQDRRRVRTVLESLDVADKTDSYPSELSQGQQQRVVIARAVMNRPRVLLADEPTSSLDDVRAEQVLRLLTEQAREYDATLIVATHDRRITGHFEHRLELYAGTPTEAAP